jgi:hypothetical protein
VGRELELAARDPPCYVFGMKPRITLYSDFV